MERKDGDEPLPSHLQHVDMNSEGSGTSDSGDVPRGPDGSSILLVDSRHPLDAPGRSIPLIPVLLPSSTGKDNHDNATSLSGATRPNEASHPAFPSSVPFLTTEELRVTLENFYRAHNPKNADKIDAFLKRYQGREPQLLLDVQAKYKDGGVHITDYMPNTVDVEACVSVLEEKNSRADTSAVCNRRESTALSSFFAPGDSKPAVKAKGDNHSASSSVDVGVLPALLLKAFKKKDSTHSQVRQEPSPSDSQTNRPPRHVSSPSLPSPPAPAIPSPRQEMAGGPHGSPLPSSSSADSQATDPVGAAGATPLPPSLPPSLPADPMSRLTDLEAERDALRKENHRLSARLHTLRKHVAHRDHQADAWQRNLLSLLDKDRASQGRLQETHERLVDLEAKLREKEAVVASLVEREARATAAWREAVGLQRILQSQVQSFMGEHRVHILPLPATGMLLDEDIERPELPEAGLTAGGEGGHSQATLDRPPQLLSAPSRSRSELTEGSGGGRGGAVGEPQGVCEAVDGAMSSSRLGEEGQTRGGRGCGPFLDAGRGGTPEAAERESAIETSFKATRLELEAARRLGQALEEACSALHGRNQDLHGRVVTLQCEQEALREQLRERDAALSEAGAEMGRRAEEKDALEAMLRTAQADCRHWEQAVEDAHVRIQEGEVARRALETFAQEFRRDVEAAAEARIVTAMGHMREEMEELGARHAALRAAAEELRVREGQTGKEEMEGLTQALMQSRLETARREKEVEKLRVTLARLSGKAREGQSQERTR